MNPCRWQPLGLIAFACSGGQPARADRNRAAPPSPTQGAGNGRPCLAMRGQSEQNGSATRCVRDPRTPLRCRLRSGTRKGRLWVGDDDWIAVDFGLLGDAFLQGEMQPFPFQRFQLVTECHSLSWFAMLPARELRTLCPLARNRPFDRCVM